MEFFQAIDRTAGRKVIFLLALFLLSFIFRFPTLFNDFYDVDELSAIVQTHEYMAGDVPGVDFKESKLLLYHLIFKISYVLCPENGWVIVHFINIIIVFLTAFFVYLIGKSLYDFRTGALASIFYAVFISSFNRHFMATNGEVVFNLPLAAGLYYFIIFLKTAGSKRYAALLLSFVMGAAAAYVKFHGMIFFIFLAVFFLLYYPYFLRKINHRYISFISGILFAAILLLIFDYFYKDWFASRVLADAGKKIFYAVAKSTDPFYFLYRFIHRQGMLLLWHMTAWVPAFIFLIRFARNSSREKTIEESAVVIFFLFTYSMAFAGLARLYFHYFMICYPALCVLASAAINRIETGKIIFFKKRIMILIMIPSIFFLSWNTKDIIIKHFYPSSFYNEGKFLYWTRAVLVGTFNDYLLPDASLLGTCEYIKQITKPEDRIFVWGDGPVIYYFSGRRVGAYHMWPKTSVIRINTLYEEGTEKSLAKARKEENKFIKVLDKKTPILFLDTSENGFSSFTFKLTPIVETYVKEHYDFLKEIDKIKIYILKEPEQRKE
ncbi:MAG: glycosyltransferase family 39 protein [Spirochaetes bacterium]|nr:glycosyltransferase family 39 protein [Spirochaetota bacterium]